jgi:hypothetical protein
MRKFFVLAVAASVVIACNQNAEAESDAAVEEEVVEGVEVEATDEAAHDHGSMEEATSMDPESEYLEVPEDASVFFVNLTDGKVVPNEVTVVMGVEGMDVNPAGELIIGTGHHHILIDGEPMPKGTFIPKDENHIHFGNGQTEAAITIPSGEHTLTLQFANGAHFSYGEQMSATITVTAP